MIPTCIECSEPLRGRADKKFCDDVCRTAYHNRLNKNSNRLVRIINRRLQQNRRILDMLWNAHPLRRVPAEVLRQNGYDFRYSTHIRNSEPGSQYIFCYDLGLKVTEDGQEFQLLKEAPAPPSGVK